MIIPFGSPDRYLRGTYLYSYSGFLRADPPYKASKAVPQLPAYIQQDAMDGGGLTQVPGFVPIGYAGWITFGNSQSLSGRGSSQIGGSKAVRDVEISGTVADLEFHATSWFSGFISGTFITFDVTDLSVNFTHSFVLSGDRNRIAFTVTDGGLRDLVASGELVRTGVF